jgi:hypothetical protein
LDLIDQGLLRPTLISWVRVLRAEEFEQMAVSRHFHPALRPPYRNGSRLTLPYFQASRALPRKLNIKVAESLFEQGARVKGEQK